jgi:hypothetical protein
LVSEKVADHWELGRDAGKIRILRDRAAAGPS